MDIGSAAVRDSSRFKKRSMCAATFVIALAVAPPLAAAADAHMPAPDSGGPIATPLATVAPKAGAPAKGKHHKHHKKPESGGEPEGGAAAPPMMAPPDSPTAPAPMPPPDLP